MSGDLILEWYCSWKLWLSSVWKSALIKLGYVVSTQLLFFLLLNAFVIELFSILCIVIELFSTHCTCWISCVVHLFNATDFKTYIYIYIYIVCVGLLVFVFSVSVVCCFSVFLVAFGCLLPACEKKKIPNTNWFFKTRFMELKFYILEFHWGFYFLFFLYI